VFAPLALAVRLDRLPGRVVDDAPLWHRDPQNLRGITGAHDALSAALDPILEAMDVDAHIALSPQDLANSRWIP
jgi:hypothetical protein